MGIRLAVLFLAVAPVEVVAAYLVGLRIGPRTAVCQFLAVVQGIRRAGAAGVLPSGFGRKVESLDAGLGAQYATSNTLM